MIKDNQKSLNRFHVVLDACVTAFSYLLAWFIVIGSGWANQLGKRTLEVVFWRAARYYSGVSAFVLLIWTVHPKACAWAQKRIRKDL